MHVCAHVNTSSLLSTFDLEGGGPRGGGAPTGRWTLRLGGGGKKSLDLLSGEKPVDLLSPSKMLELDGCGGPSGFGGPGELFLLIGRCFGGGSRGFEEAGKLGGGNFGFEEVVEGTVKDGLPLSAGADLIFVIPVLGGDLENIPRFPSLVEEEDELFVRPEVAVSLLRPL